MDGYVYALLFRAKLYARGNGAISKNWVISWMAEGSCSDSEAGGARVAAKFDPLLSSS